MRRKLAVRVLVAFALTQLVFASAVLASMLVPNNAVETELTQSILKGYFANAYAATQNADYEFGLTTPRVDLYTECVALADHMAPAPRMNWFKLAFYDSGPLECAQANNVLVHHADIENGGYWRYWNGTTAISRPFIALSGVQGLRVLVEIALWASLFWAALSVRRVSGTIAAVALLGPLVLTGGFTDLVESIPHAVTAAVMLLGIVALAKTANRRPGDAGAVLLVAMLSGCAYNFVDLLSNPPGAIALSVGTVALVTAHTKIPRPRLLLCSLAAFLGWIFGWAFTWATKWAIAAVLFGPRQVWDTVRYETLFRSRGSGVSGTGPVAALSKTLKYWENLTFISHNIVFGLEVVLGGVLLILMLRRQWSAISYRLIVASPAVLAPIWMAVMHQHTSTQVFFTFADWPMAAGVLCAGLLAGDGPKLLPAEAARLDPPIPQPDLTAT